MRNLCETFMQPYHLLGTIVVCGINIKYKMEESWHE